MAVKANDQITIVDLTDAYAVNLTNDSYVFAGDKNGKVSSQQSVTTVIQALRGSETVSISIDATAITKPSGITVSYQSSIQTLTITASTSVASNGVVVIPVSVDNGAVTITKTFSFSIAKTGATGSNGTSYFTYIRYSANANGSNMTDTPTSSTAYIGVYSGTSSSVPAYTSFTWSKYQGDDGADAITLVVTSSAGTIFKNTDIATTLTAHVYKAGVEITGNAISSLGTIKWYKDGSSTAAATGTTLSISAGDVTNKVTYEARLES